MPSISTRSKGRESFLDGRACLTKVIDHENLLPPLASPGHQHKIPPDGVIE
jgi:hypothetical protein